MRCNVYRLVTVSDGKSDTDSIAQVFSEMLTGRLKSDLKLLNYYREIPVSYAGSLVSVKDDRVELKVHEIQAMVMTYDKTTLIKSKHFHNGLGVHCYATHVDIAKKMVILESFAYAQIRAERREAVRVKVHKTVSVTFFHKGVTIEGTMVDISGNGISIKFDFAPQLDTDRCGRLDFALCGTPLAVQGSFVKSSANRAGGSIAVFAMKPGRMSDMVIGQFINQQQIEIIQELKGGLVVNNSGYLEVCIS